MGVAGVGKTTVGRALAHRLEWTFLDADDDHPPANVAKMARGEPLTEEDRRGWIEAVRDRLVRHVRRGEDVVLACSALRRAHRALLAAAAPRVDIVHLTAPHDVIERRLLTRAGHFAGPELLGSQLDDMELPEDAVVIDATLPVAEIVARIDAALEL